MNTFEKVCDWLECRLAERKKHRAATAPLQAVPSPVQITHSTKASDTANDTAKHAVPTTSRKRPFRANRDLRIVSAQDALRRNAESNAAFARTE